MMKRSKHMILSQILNICNGGASKTRIVYQANLNFKTVNPYIILLIKNNLIQIKYGRNVMYETTERGISMLDDLKHINSMLCECEDAITA